MAMTQKRIDKVVNWSPERKQAALAHLQRVLATITMKLAVPGQSAETIASLQAQKLKASQRLAAYLTAAQGQGSEAAQQAVAQEVGQEVGGTFWEKHKMKVIVGGAIVVALGILYAKK